MPRAIARALQLLFVAGLLAILVWQTRRLDARVWDHLRQGETRPVFLALALATYLTAVGLTFVRWRSLARAIGIPLGMGDAMALGFLGYLMQFVSLGSVGGDVFKAYAVSRLPGATVPGTIASIVVDRLVGFLSMLLCGVIAFWWCAQGGGMIPELRPFAWLCGPMALAGLGLLYLVLYTPARIADLCYRLRWLHPAIPHALRLDAGLAQYRAHRGSVWWAVGVGVVSHGLQATALGLVAHGLQPEGIALPRYAEFVAIWPIAGGAGSLPLTPGGLGTFDAAYTYLYDLHAARADAPRIGLVISLVFRLICLVTAAMGLGVYIVHRQRWLAVRMLSREQR